MSGYLRASTDALDRLNAVGAAILQRWTLDSPVLEGATLVAIGWATVEIERGEKELEAAVGAGGSWVDAPRDALLGARAAIYRLGEVVGPLLVLLEPDTEGRLAASLARHGEGVAAVYVTARPGSVLERGSFGIPAGGPLGRGQCLAVGRLGEPSIVVLETDPRSP